MSLFGGLTRAARSFLLRMQGRDPRKESLVPAQSAAARRSAPTYFDALNRLVAR